MGFIIVDLPKIKIETQDSVIKELFVKEI